MKSTVNSSEKKRNLISERTLINYSAPDNVDGQLRTHFRELLHEKCEKTHFHRYVIVVDEAKNFHASSNQDDAV